MSAHTSLSGAKAADRLALRELVDAYASCADRRDAKGQIALFTETRTLSSTWMRSRRRRRANCTGATT